MMSRGSEKGVAAVRETLREALRHWEGSNLKSISACQALLDRSLADLRRLHEAAAAGMPLSAQDRQDLLGIQSSISGCLRVVDASFAFVAGMSGIAADTGMFYNAAGIAGRHSEMESVCRIL
jgi:hypothetical protein